eukprot:m.208040 g.208040  ORF g.208040 m.208040 type:complete len:1154 (-) comp26079_c0_seq4:30-3491(-)
MEEVVEGTMFVTPNNRQANHDSGQHFLKNKIRTTKYTILTLLPKNLFEQFHRFANVYFLFIVILNWIPEIQAFGREVAMLPLVFVLLVTLVKDSYEDRRRARSDKEVNAREATVMDNETGEWRTIRWKKIEVGDIIKLNGDDIIPADILLLHTSSQDGICYLETANLDGETNLKRRRTFVENEEEFDIKKFNASVHCDLPNNRIYDYNGHITLNGKKIALDSSNLLLRGCVLRNTDFVHGMVIYAGHDTKAMLNNTGPRSKRSKLERQMNFHVIYCLLILLGMCVSGAIATGAFLVQNDPKDTIFLVYDSGDPPPGEEAFIRFWTFFIIFQVMVPISLYVSIEIVKLLQVYFLQQDLDLYHEKSDKPMFCRALNITEDLGQIEYIFSDKTGTLTQNCMVFRMCSVAGVDYPHQGVPPPDDNEDEGPEDVLEPDEQLAAHIASDPGECDDPTRLHLFLLNLAACNTVVPTYVDKTETENPGTGRRDSHFNNPADLANLSYEAESPDEAALVDAARVYDYTLITSTTETTVIRIKGQSVTYQLLQVLPFNSKRKRMSVILRLPNGKIRMLTKGADSAIQKALVPGVDEGLLKKTQEQILCYAKLGLRTLSFAYRDLDEDYYQKWAENHLSATTDHNHRKQRVEDSILEIETQLTLLGATGVEDKLQVGVPRTIASLREAGIKVWVLTGDKQETAIEIARTCQLVTDEMHLILLNSEAAIKQAENAAADVRGQLYDLIADARKEAALGKELALVVDGATLAYALPDTEDTEEQAEGKIGCLKKKDVKDPDSVSQLFLRLALLTKVVVCCRVIPLQKAKVVELVKVNEKVMTLSIGDGANDVSMIQMADVGVGISGQEGMQAVMASDFAIAQFRFLEKLLLVHGHWSYIRIARMILYFFYKNAFFVFIIYWFQVFNGFSGQVAIEQLYLSTFNLAWTSLPIMIFAIFEQDVPDTILIANPILYEEGRLDLAYRGFFWPYLLDALYQSVILFFIPYAAYNSGAEEIGLVHFGTTLNTCAVLTASLQIAIMTRFWTWIHHLILYLSIILYFVFGLAYNAMLLDTPLVPDPYWVMEVCFGTSVFWICSIFCPIIAVLPHFIAMFVKDRFYPTRSSIAREAAVLKERNKLPDPLSSGTAVRVRANLTSPLVERMIRQDSQV